jgi:6-phosphogluconolactonase
VHPSGKFLFTANKGTSNVSVFSIDSNTGALKQITNSPFATGAGPVFLNIDSAGRLLYAGNQSSQNITGFTINQSTGALTGGVAGPNTSSAPTSMSTTR